jgi:hypothetical protein
VLITSSRFKTERLDFETHLKYATLIAKLSSKLKVTSSLIPKLKASDVPKLKDKIQLVKLTKLSLDQEYKIVALDKDYSTASVLWLPIKSYYLLYHLLCITDCIITGKITSLSAGHHDCVDVFNKMLKDKEISFGEPMFNTVFDESILDFTTKSGEHLKASVSDDTVYRLIMKKVANGKIDNYKIVFALSGRRTKDKVKIDRFRKNIEVSIFDFFHLMRLRTNYRNLNFVDDVPSADTKAYFEQYYQSADNFYKCFTDYINELIKKCS